MRFPLPPALGALMSPFTKEGLNIRTPYIRKERSVIAISSLLAASCTSTHNTEIFFTARSGSAKPQTLMPLELDEQWGRFGVRYLRWLQLLHLSQAACSCVALSYLWSKSLKSHNPWWRNPQSVLVYLDSPCCKLWWFITHNMVPTRTMWCRVSPDGSRMGSSETEAFPLLPSVVTVPVLGVEHSQNSADAPGEENWCQDHRMGDSVLEGGGSGVHLGVIMSNSHKMRSQLCSRRATVCAHEKNQVELGE